MSVVLRPDEMLRVLPDGTVKQVNPFTGTHVWTVPGRGDRPLGQPPSDVDSVDEGPEHSLCAFCSDRMRETPPEIARVVRVDEAERSGDSAWRTLSHVSPGALHATRPAFRRIPNLFAIVGYDYWRLNHGFAPSPALTATRDDYLDAPGGAAHVRAVLATRLAAQGHSSADVEALDDAALRIAATALFASSHDVIVAGDHLAPGATNTGQLASSGTLGVDEHRAFMQLTLDAVEDLYVRFPAATYVTAFQNWLRPAGASFDHLHKQVVAMDSHSAQTSREAALLAECPGAYNKLAVDHAVTRGLVVAENEHAVAVAGVGHRYPSLEVFSRSAQTLPWLMPAQEREAVFDLVHALHAATGPDVPVNEEWHHRPPGLAVAMPFRIVLKWRVNTPAGFEGSTKVFVNTIDPWGVRERITAQLRQCRREGLIAPLRIGEECSATLGTLRYAL